MRTALVGKVFWSSTWFCKAAATALSWPSWGARGGRGRERTGLSGAQAGGYWLEGCWMNSYQWHCSGLGNETDTVQNLITICVDRQSALSASWFGVTDGVGRSGWSAGGQSCCSNQKPGTWADQSCLFQQRQICLGQNRITLCNWTGTTEKTWKMGQPKFFCSYTKFFAGGRFPS